MSGSQNDPAQAPASPPAAASAPATEPSKAGRPSEADLRAELAAMRIAERSAREAAEATKAELQRAKEEAEKLIQTQTEGLRKTASTLESRVVESELKAAAMAAGIRDLDLLGTKLLDRGGIKLDENGNVVGVEEAIAKFKQAKPDWFKSEHSEDGAKASPPAPKKPGSSDPPPAPGPREKVDVRTMTPEQYRDFKRKWMASLPN